MRVFITHVNLLCLFREKSLNDDLFDSSDKGKNNNQSKCNVVRIRKVMTNLNVCKVYLVVLKEGDEFLEVLFCGVVMTTVRPDSHKNTFMGY